jgi:hypothetical protein
VKGGGPVADQEGDQVGRLLRQVLLERAAQRPAAPKREA